MAKSDGKTKQSNDTQKNKKNGMNSPTEPQEKRVVPLLMVWMSRCGGRHVGPTVTDVQNKPKSKKRGGGEEKFAMFLRSLATIK